MAKSDETTSMSVEEPSVIICAGPPQCIFLGDEAVENANAGCPLCRRIIIHGDGSETEFRVPAQ